MALQRTVVATGTGVVLAALVSLTSLAAEAPAPADDADCEPADLSAILPAQVGSVTFIGTYLGDARLDSSDRSLLHSWSVDMVYAGTHIPADLVFRSPACEWTNLTPGVRYLFSTASESPSIALPNSTAPTALDSLAWQIVDEERVRLAPFDSYESSDYDPTVAAIETLSDAIVAVGAGEPAPPSPAESFGFGCTARIGPDQVADAMGTAFIGRYVGQERLPSGNVEVDDRRVSWSVQRVLADRPLEEVLTMRSPGCLPVGLEPGKRYLFSTASIASPSISNSLAWRIKPDGAVAFAPFTGTDARDYPEEVRGLKTVEAVTETLGLEDMKEELPLRAGDRTPD